MAKKYVTSSIIDNLTFYAFGRLEREIEGLAERTGVLKSDFTGRLSALLGNTPLWPVLGDSDPMSLVQEKAEPTGVHIQQPTLALGEPAPSHRVHHDQGAQGKSAARRKVAGMHRAEGNREKSARYRALVMELLYKLTPPIRSNELHRLFRDKTGMPRGTDTNTSLRMVKEGILEKRGKFFFWGAQPGAAVPHEHGGQLVNGGEKKKHIKKAPSLPKGEAVKIVMNFAKGKQMSQAEMCQKLRQKHPEINRYVWNATITNMVKRGQLKRWADGTVVAAKGMEHGKSATAN